MFCLNLWPCLLCSSSRTMTHLIPRDRGRKSTHDGWEGERERETCVLRLDVALFCSQILSLIIYPAQGQGSLLGLLNSQWGRAQHLPWCIGNSRCRHVDRGCSPCRPHPEVRSGEVPASSSWEKCSFILMTESGMWFHSWTYFGMHQAEGLGCPSSYLLNCLLFGNIYISQLLWDG